MPWIERGVPGCTMSCASPPREVIPRRLRIEFAESRGIGQLPLPHRQSSWRTVAMAWHLATIGSIGGGGCACPQARGIRVPGTGNAGWDGTVAGQLPDAPERLGGARADQTAACLIPRSCASAIRLNWSASPPMSGWCRFASSR